MKCEFERYIALTFGPTSQTEIACSKINKGQYVKKGRSLHGLYAFVTLYVSDYSKGFGGKFGVQTDRKDASAVGWDHQEKLEQHESQKGNF